MPYVIEPSLGADRVTLAFLVEAYDEEVVDEAKRIRASSCTCIRSLRPLGGGAPASKKLGDRANEIYAALPRDFMVDYDESGSIGKRYRRQDEIGSRFASPWTSIWKTTGV